MYCEPVTAQDGLRVMQIIEAVYQSSEQKKLYWFIIFICSRLFYVSL
jgi:hypothetical protein